MKLNDYKCGSCGSLFEVFSGDDAVACLGCDGQAQRQLGGRPATTNMGGFELQRRFRPVGDPVTLPRCAEHRTPTTQVQLGVIESRRVPKAKA